MQQDATAPSRSRALILGHGEMGHALEHLLRPRHDLRIWQRHAPPGAPMLDLAAEARAADFVLFCLPASPHAELAARLAPALRTGTICLSVAKGLDDRGRTAAQVFAEVFGRDHAHAVLYGPMISEEIRAGRPAFAECGCAAVATFERVRAFFSGAALVLHHSTDLAGVSWSAVLKNVYAMLFGVADELGLGDNARGYLTVATLAELDRLVVVFGGQRGTPYGLAGLGDLVTTATSAGSHHHELGRRLARGEAADLAGEGLHTLATARRRALFNPDQYPLMALIEQIVDEPSRARALLAQYMANLYAAARRD